MENASFSCRGRVVDLSTGGFLNAIAVTCFQSGSAPLIGGNVSGGRLSVANCGGGVVGGF